MLNEQINKLFNEKQFMQIVEELEEFAENQKLVCLFFHIRS